MGRKTKLWTILDETTVYDCRPFVRVVKQRVATDLGVEVNDYFQVVLPDFAICCPIDADGRVITLWQYKHGARSYGLTFPAGQIEPGEDPEVGIRRELIEESGYRARDARFLGRFAVSGNQGCGWGHFYVLTDCERIAEPNAGDLETMDICLMNRAEIDAAIAANAISVMAHITLWGLARSFVQSNGPTA